MERGRARPPLRDRLLLSGWYGPIMGVLLGVAAGVAVWAIAASVLVSAGVAVVVAVGLGVATPRLPPGTRELMALPRDDGARVVEAVRTGGAVTADLAGDVRAHADRVEARTVAAGQVARLSRKPTVVVAVLGLCFVVGGLALGDLGQVATGGMCAAFAVLNGWVTPRLQATVLANARRARHEADLVHLGGAS